MKNLRRSPEDIGSNRKNVLNFYAVVIEKFPQLVVETHNLFSMIRMARINQPSS